jgi:glyoxylase-like metal-dependent hydrolase (beta-lactamase superfamily II)
MRLPKEKVLFAVDFVSIGSVPGRGMIDSYPIEWEDSLRNVLSMDWEKVIPGHPGAPGGSRPGDESNLLFALRRYCGLWGDGT